MNLPRLNRSSTRRVVAGLALVAGIGIIGASVGGPASALADTCPTSNPPNELLLSGGSPQTAKIHQAFDETLQVTLANTNGCSVTTNETGVAVTFTAPSSGATGTFAASGSNTVTVGTNDSGQASASGFNANSNAGSYTVSATSNSGSVYFSLTNTASGVAATITPGTPASQSATVGSRYAQPLQATVLDANGSPIDGASVTFTLGTTGGSGAGGTGASAAAASFDGGASQATELTNAAGTATSPLFTANTTAGTFTASAATAGVVEPASFTLDNLAGIPPRIDAVAPTKQSAAVGAGYDKPLQAKVLDGSGSPLQGATVTFTLGSAANGAGAGAGSGSAGADFADGSSQATETTNASGVATSPRFSANTTAGRFTATATTTGANEVASFSLDNLAGQTPTITIDGRAKQSARVGTQYAKPLQVKVRDGSGKLSQGASVTFNLGATGGGAGSTSAAEASFIGGSSQATETTNAAGVATSPRLAANTTAGAFTATATTTGTTKAASFPLHNLPGQPTTITAGVAATESTAVGTRFPIRLAVTVSDKDDNPVAGVTVGFSAPTHGASGHFDGKKRTVKVKTDAKGVAVAPLFVANDTQGGYVVRASAAGRSAAFALVNQPAA
jgi:protocatechuate 3,4-dioxygenase beta subunit